jgi:3-dehydroquinate synthase
VLRHIEVPADRVGYDVFYGRGVLQRLPEVISSLGCLGTIVVCTDVNVESLHADTVLALLRGAGVKTALWSMPAGEQFKTLDSARETYDWLSRESIERVDTILALGGGVIGDLAGFVAATYLRGLRLIHVPTTLVAQVDSALGGKVAVDLSAGKNLVGAFYQPAAVVADTDLLGSLPDCEWRAGLAEVIKHGIIRDTGLLELLERDRRRVLGRDDPAAMAGLVARAAGVKIDIVEEDPFERGTRRILNYGHTLGHAIEREAGYGAVRHGFAVAWGMAAAARIGAHIGTCDSSFVAWQDHLLNDYGLLIALPRLSADSLLAATAWDKKSANRRIHWVLPIGRGHVTVTADVSDAAVRSAAEWIADRSGSGIPG